MDKLNNEQMEKIKECSLFTGSRCFDYLNCNKDSDYDFVIMKDDAERIIPEFLKGKDEKNKSMFEVYHAERYEGDVSVFVSLRFIFEKFKNTYEINLIVVDTPDLFDAWKFATNAFKTESNMDLLNKVFVGPKGKEIKKLFFESIKHAFLKSADILKEKENKSTHPIPKPRLWKR